MQEGADEAGASELELFGCKKFGVPEGHRIYYNPQLFPLYNILRLKSMLNTFVRSIHNLLGNGDSLENHGELANWRINMKSFAEVMVYNCWKTLQKYEAYI